MFNLSLMNEGGGGGGGGTHVPIIAIVIDTHCILFYNFS